MHRLRARHCYGGRAVICRAGRQECCYPGEFFLQGAELSLQRRDMFFELLYILLYVAEGV
jgi:hypothetical protein